MQEKKLQIIEDPKVTIRKAVRKTTVISLSVIIITIAAIFFLVKEINKKTLAIQTKQNLIYSTNQKANASAELMRQWLEIAPNMEKINNSLPAASNLLDYMGELEKIASEVGVSQNVKIQSVPTNGVVVGSVVPKGASVEYTIELKGDFNQFDDYLSRLENAPFYTQITAVNYIGPDSTSKTSIGSATIGAKVYTFGN
ncbi:TPA: hypothetical protein DD449_04615 [Candidatus Berkelbacteria bacterium]|uniref:Uncharacterized protein n=1 Tax=Berkelbacteria bacterium GW2011_GWE1_39_12 TaxID=1618337 RepID=A0A0G4B4M1_9BACT|nr:MAG: hypothetical protein UT28_C0001G0543 [Berkelbacteria bacterium GW2011_GWE1_39_12]HBO60938.1 hypothetical protein [Candidatus Berkelbacteria bacterium]